MISETFLRRSLYVGTFLVIIVTLILAFMVIPSVRLDSSPQATPEIAVKGIWVVIIIHLLIVAALVGTVLANQKGERIKKELLYAVGIVLLLLSLLILDGASDYLDHTDPIMHRVPIRMFVCIVCNFIASVLAFLTAWYSSRLQPTKK